jgi:cell division protein FtsB
MPQVPGVAAPAQDPLTAQIGELRAKANELKLRVSDLTQRKAQLIDASARSNTPHDQLAVDRQVADVQHELAGTQIQLETTNEQINELTTQRDMARTFSLGGPPAIAMTAPPAPDPFLGPKEIMTVSSGLFILALPLVIVLARRLWVRSPRATVDLESSPRLQRIEQAIESIAVEVERIGEAQRFTTKLLSDRQPDAVARMMAPRKEPGTITPH